MLMSPMRLLLPIVESTSVFSSCCCRLLSSTGGTMPEKLGTMSRLRIAPQHQLECGLLPPSHAAKFDNDNCRRRDCPLLILIPIWLCNRRDDLGIQQSRSCPCETLQSIDTSLRLALLDISGLVSGSANILNTGDGLVSLGLYLVLSLVCCCCLDS
jgi:hypothetical protein